MGGDDKLKPDGQKPPPKQPARRPTPRDDDLYDAGDIAAPQRDRDDESEV